MPRELAPYDDELTDPEAPGQLGALFEGLDWKRMHSRRVARPQLAQ